MNELAIAMLRLGLLLALWILIISIVLSQGRDLVVGRRNKTRLAQAQRDAGLVTAVPAAGTHAASADRPAARRAAGHAPAAEQAPASSNGASTPGSGGDRVVSAPTPTAPAPRLARTLRITEGPLAGQTVDLDGSPVLLGRAQDADLVLVDDYASGRHARLFPQGTRWFLEDLGSTNGTYVDGAPLTRAQPVGTESTVRIGKTVIVLEA